MANKLLDTNVVARVLLEDTKCPKYKESKLILIGGGLIKDYVMPEIIYAFKAAHKRGLARVYAVQHNELDKFDSDPRIYTLHWKDCPSGWKQHMYTIFHEKDGCIASRLY